jgi:hypothetical protein
VHNLDTRLWGPTRELRSSDTDADKGKDGVLQSPFAGSDYTQIQQRLQQTKNTTRSPLNTKWFLVLDGESERTGTAVIVNIDDDDDDDDDGNVVARSVRVAWPVASRYLSAASIGHPPLDELIEVANDEGAGVLRD